MVKKKNSQQSNKTFKPEAYIRQKARQLPIYKCYKSVNNFEDREMSVIVVRQHPQGTYTLAAFMLDKWCLGVKDTFWQFSVDESELQKILGFFRETLDSLDEIEYVEAHNWVYGALAFAEEAGIKPCKDFALTQYILEEDNDDVELIEYDFGRDGEYCLVAKDNLEASRYIPILDKTLGKGNYTVEVGMFGDDEYDYMDYEDDDDNDRFPFAFTPSMEYTYKGKDYPKEITLNYPEIEDVVRTPIEDITDDDIDNVLTLPADKAREDLQNIVLREIGRQWGKTAEEIGDEDDEWYVVSNSLMFLTKFGTVEDTLPVVLEVMRQSQAFRDYYFGDISDRLLDPVLCVLIKDNPRLLKPYLLEPGLYYSYKLCALELLEHIAQHCPEVRQAILDMTVELLEEYKRDLPKRTICDGTVTAFAISIFVGNGATEYLPLIEELYATGMIDEGCEGHIDEVRRNIKNPYVQFDLPASDPKGVRNEYREFCGMK